MIDRCISWGQSGPFYSEVRGAMQGTVIPMYGFIAGLGGRDVGIKEIESAVKYMQENAPGNIVWIGVKE